MKASRKPIQDDWRQWDPLTQVGQHQDTKRKTDRGRVSVTT